MSIASKALWNPEPKRESTFQALRGRVVIKELHRFLCRHMRRTFCGASLRSTSDSELPTTSTLNWALDYHTLILFLSGTIVKQKFINTFFSLGYSKAQ